MRQVIEQLPFDVHFTLMEGLSLRSVYDIIAFRQDGKGRKLVLVDWNERMVLHGETLYVPLEWIPLENIVFKDQGDFVFFVTRARRGQAYFTNNSVAAMKASWSSETYGWSAEEDMQWRLSCAANEPCESDGNNNGEAGKRGVLARAERWWLGLNVEEEEEEEEEEGDEDEVQADEAVKKKQGKTHVVYTKRGSDDVAGFLDDMMTTPNKAARTENEVETPMPSRKLGIFAALSQRIEEERSAVGEVEERSRAWTRVFEAAKGDPSFDYLHHFEARWNVERGPHLVCCKCNEGVISIQGVKWDADASTWVKKPKWGNARRHLNRDHPNAEQTRQLRRGRAEKETRSVLSIVDERPGRALDSASWVSSRLNQFGSATLKLSEVPAEHMAFLFSQLKINLHLYLLDEELCHQAQRYQSQDGIQRFTSIIANGFGVYWESQWLKSNTQVLIDRKKVPGNGNVVYSVQFALCCSDFSTIQSHMLKLLERCVEMESVIHASRWDGTSVTLQAPQQPDRHIVHKALGGKAARKGQLVDSETTTEKVLHHVEFLTYLLVRGYQRNVGLPLQMLEAEIRALQQEAKRHRNGLRKQTLSFRHQAFVQNASRVLLVYQTMHENHVAHVQFFSQVNEALAAGIVQSEASKIRQSLYSSHSFVEYLLEGFMTMTLLEHGVQRTQVYRELVLLHEVVQRDVSTIAHLSGKILSGLLEEPGGCFSMLIAADKIQNAGVLKLPYSWQGAVIISVLVDYLTFLVNTDTPVAAGSQRLSRKERLNDFLEQIEGPDDGPQGSEDDEMLALFQEEDEVEDEEDDKEAVEPSVSVAKSLADMLPRVLVHLSGRGRYEAIIKHSDLFHLYARGVEMTTVNKLPESMEQLEVDLQSRVRRQVLPEPLANHRVLRSWSEEYLSLVTLRQDPTFLADSSMMRRHSFGTVRTTYAPAHEEAASAELVRRQGILMGKRPTDYPTTELDNAVMWHLQFLQQSSSPVAPSTQQAIRLLSQQRFTPQQASPPFMFSLLRDNVIEQFEALLRQECTAQVPVPTMVGSLVCMSQLGSFDMPCCDECRLPMQLASLTGAVSADGSTLLLSNARIVNMPMGEGHIIVKCMHQQEIHAIIYCGGHSNTCQQNLALLTSNSMRTNAIYTIESRTEIFTRK